MIDGDVYNIRSPMNNIREFIKKSLMPDGGQLIWYEIVRGEVIQVDNIVSIKELNKEELNKIADENKVGPQETQDQPEEIGGVAVKPKDAEEIGGIIVKPEVAQSEEVPIVLPQ